MARFSSVVLVLMASLLLASTRAQSPTSPSNATAPPPESPKNPPPSPSNATAPPSNATTNSTNGAVLNRFSAAGSVAVGFFTAVLVM
ncbi:classical arabinogalactan protein 1-like [Prunus yedoensis var. nudiflora]|uniref:Classical arabinogalactan protein 1-like n=1 Tax=Prunus yedoensis var. nudiflora TaxID=2094558 RepID=A0A314Y406_PRUYE|nr:classical arabinogalactan protein 1-like [Prunus yedoensis var. nudiflora]